MIFTGQVWRYLIFASWWGILILYEIGLLLLTIAAQRRGRPSATMDLDRQHDHRMPAPIDGDFWLNG